MRVNAKGPTSGNGASWAVVAALVVAVAAVELVRPMAIEVRGLAGLSVACIALCAAATFYTRVRVDERFNACCVGLTQASPSSISLISRVG